MFCPPDGLAYRVEIRKLDRAIDRRDCRPFMTHLVCLFVRSEIAYWLAIQIGESPEFCNVDGAFA
jgi:hypothetical protein